MKKTTLSYKVPFPSKSLIETFSDLNKYAQVHPLILKAEKTKIDPNKYKITERPFKYVPIKISYQATVRSNKDEVEYLISKIPFTKLTIKYAFLSLNTETTEIKCSIQLQSKLIGKTILFRKLIKAQNDLMNSLDQYFKSKM